MALTTNIVADYKLSDLTDEVASADLTNNNSVAFNAGKIGNAADFGASNTTKYLSETSGLGIDGGNISLSCWVKITTQPASNYSSTILYQGNDTSHVVHHLEYKDISGTKTLAFNRLKAGVADGFCQYSVSLTTGTWYFVVATYNGTNSNLYLNASLGAGPTALSGSGSATITTGFGSGQSLYQAGRFFSGLVDEVGVWSRALTTTEITELYNSGDGLQYPFVESSFIPSIMTF